MEVRSRMRAFIRKILAPVDGSESSHQAVEVTTRLAKITGAKVTVMHVIPHTILYGRLRSGYQIPTDIRNQIIGGIEDNARKAIDDAHAFLTENGVVTNTTMPKFSDVADTILRTAKRGYDLIIMGARGEDVMDPYGVGSVTKKVVRHSKTPALIVKKSSSLSNVLVCLDGSRHSINALNFAVKIGELTKSKITLINVQDRHLHELSPETAENLSQYILSHAIEKILKTDLKIDKRVAFGAPPDAIVGIAEKEGYDLVVLSSIGHETISELLLGSVSEGVIQKARCSVLVVPPKR